MAFRGDRVRECKELDLRCLSTCRLSIQLLCSLENLLRSFTFMSSRVIHLPQEAAAIEIEQLLKACRRHESLAWEALVRRFQDRVYSLCCCYLHNSAEAEEVAQEAFVQMFRNLSQFKGTAEGLTPWLLAITRHCCIDRQRHNRARISTQSLSSAATLPGNHDDAEGVEFLWHTGEHSPEQTLASQQETRLLYRALQRSSPETRDLIMLKDIQGLKIEEVAHILDLPVGTVKSKWHRAKLELARTIVQLSTPGQPTAPLQDGATS